jgi:hypothetical protein
LTRLSWAFGGTHVARAPRLDAPELS